MNRVTTGVPACEPEVATVWEPAEKLAPPDIGIDSDDAPKSARNGPGRTCHSRVRSEKEAPWTLP
jgi:hypothetical protein